MTNAHSTLNKMEEMPFCLVCDATIQKLTNQLETLQDILEIFHREGGENRFRSRKTKSPFREVVESFRQVLDATRNESFDFVLLKNFQYLGVIMICNDSSETKELCKTNIIKRIDPLQLATKYDRAWLDKRNRIATVPASSDLLFFDIKENCQKVVKELTSVKPQYAQDHGRCMNDQNPDVNFDVMCKESLQKLQDAGLCTDEDLVMNNPLMDLGCYQLAFKKRLEYFLQLNPEGLSMCESTYGQFPIHMSVKAICSRCEGDEVANIRPPPPTDIFELVLRAGIEHYPEKLGFLFEKNRYGSVALNQAVRRYGKDTTLKIIGEYDLPRISSENGFSFLYHVFKFTPKLANDVINMYPSVTEVPRTRKNEHDDVSTGDYFPDHLTIGLQKGVILSSSNFKKVYNSQVLDEKDPVTGLYLFMVAASDIAADKTSLTTVYKLLKMSPTAVRSSAFV